MEFYEVDRQASALISTIFNGTIEDEVCWYFFAPVFKVIYEFFPQERESFRPRAWPLLADIPTIASPGEARGQVHSSDHTRRCLVCFMSQIAELEIDFAEATTS